MFGEVESEVEQAQLANAPSGLHVTELGCGMGVLAQRLVAVHAVAYRGFDISDVAVEACRSRFLRADQLDLGLLRPEDLEFTDMVIATEVMEHLDETTFHRVAEIVLNTTTVNRFVFTVPDNCMGPDDVPEHTALFNEELVRTRLDSYVQAGWDLNIRKADDSHLICVMTRR
jgi:predicted TPR repeat methyltransferase